jgi:hypothetical protein
VCVCVCVCVVHLCFLALTWHAFPYVPLSLPAFAHLACNSHPNIDQKLMARLKKEKRQRDYEEFRSVLYFVNKKKSRL